MYISCNPQRAQRNWIELGRPESKQYKGEPFYPVSAVAVDMFPHTNHTEMIVLFERKSQNENETKPETIVRNSDKILEEVNLETKQASEEKTQEQPMGCSKDLDDVEEN